MRINTLGLSTLLIASSILMGCGWQLRGYDHFNPLAQSSLAELESINVVSENRNNAFFRAFKRGLLSQNIELDSDAEVRVDFSKEFLRRQPLTYNSSGVPAQYQLTLSLDYFASKAGTIIVEESNIVTRRNYDFDPNLIIAKDREEQELLEEMRDELSQRIIASIRRKL